MSGLNNGNGEMRFFTDQLMIELAHQLIEKGVVRRDQIDDLNSRRSITGETLDRMLVKEGLVSDNDLLAILSGLTNIPFRHIAELRIDLAAVKKVPPRIALRHNVMPIGISNGMMSLATSQVPSATTVDGLRMLLDMGIAWILCTEVDITKSIKHFYGLGAETVDNLVDASAKSTMDLQATDVSVETTDDGVVKFVNQIIFEAIKMDATDIHIEPFENDLRLRYRIDGILQEIPVPQGVAQLRKSMSSCVKIMAEMNIAERRKPHDGRIKVKSGKEEFDLRVSVLPTAHGETVCMRILNRKTMFIDLEHLGLSRGQLPKITYLADLPHGVVLLTGPTGSGKTTTLYAVLSKISTSDVKIITVEDPIEYQLFGINQIQVHPQIGLTFANVLRHILRHDPDIILIGEIRDSETADIAVRSSLTGHLVFSTLHTNDAPSSVTRLSDMEVEPYLIASCLEGVIAQRLVRRVCSACKEEVAAPEIIIQEIAEKQPAERVKNAKYYKGRGCPDCNFTGYRGRIAICEIMLLDDALRAMIVHQRPSNEIKKKALENGMETLRRDGWNRVLDGLTTIDEIVRVAKADSMGGN
ncbi:MAG: hypothetical protein C0404_13970 [Verrucomicrobia bacterium]|nr:hypothetical protein [Verrucomicrobiota bacterium]